jgi:hypothetical protein
VRCGKPTDGVDKCCLPKQQGPVDGGALQSLWYWKVVICMRVRLRISLAIQFRSRAWIAALICLLKKIVHLLKK